VAALDPPPTLTGAGTGAGDDGDAVRFALARLRPDDAEVLRLWAWEDLAPSDIATVLDVTPNAVSIRLHRARQRLAEELRKIGVPSGHEGS
jgi:RNA polymerase sigma-70 factor (ECF subfamily)